MVAQAVELQDEVDHTIGRRERHADHCEPGCDDGEAEMPSGELAEKIGISQANLSILKTGKANAVRFSTLEAICEALACQPGDILEYQKDKGGGPGMNESSGRIKPDEWKRIGRTLRLPFGCICWDFYLSAGCSFPGRAGAFRCLPFFTADRPSGISGKKGAVIPFAGWFWSAATVLTGLSYALVENQGLEPFRSLFLFCSAVYFILFATKCLLSGKTGNLLFLDGLNRRIFDPAPQSCAAVYLPFCAAERRKKPKTNRFCLSCSAFYSRFPW